MKKEIFINPLFLKYADLINKISENFGSAGFEKERAKEEAARAKKQ